MSGEMRGSGKWALGGVPHKGWTCVGIRELEQQTHLCEMCEARLVRYVHVMEHPDHESPLAVGCVCAGHMEQHPVRAREREKSFKAYQARRQRWLSRDWRVSYAGNDYLRTDGFHIVVFCLESGIWAARVRHRKSGYERISELPYESEDEAKLAAFDAMLNMKRRRPWQRNAE